MAIYHCSIKIIGRNTGRSAVASAAYRSGSKLVDEEIGLVSDYTHKQGVIYSNIVLPQNAPAEYQDRKVLWNAVQKKETVKDARLAREFEVAIPAELPPEQRKRVVDEFARSLADEGMCVDYSIHDKQDGNPHAHIMATTRRINPNGTWADKERKGFALDENGQRIPIIDPATGNQRVDGRNRKQWKRAIVQANDWNKREKVEQWRQRWADECNKYLSPEHQIDHRSYERQGIDKVPTIHEGYAARAIEARGGMSEIMEQNRHIKRVEAEYKAITAELEQAIQERGGELHDRLAEYRRQLEGVGSGDAGRAGRAERTNQQPAAGNTAEILRRAREQLSNSAAARGNTAAAVRDDQATISNREAGAARRQREQERRQREEAERRAETARNQREKAARRGRTHSRGNDFGPEL
jgi:hypothetical protein